MKKYLIILGVATLAFLSGCGLNVSISPSTSPKPVIAEGNNYIEYLGQTNYGVTNSYLYKYMDKKEGKIIYMYESGTGDGGRSIVITDIESK